jgi:hypothetical protein
MRIDEFSRASTAEQNRRVISAETASAASLDAYVGGAPAVTDGTTRSIGPFFGNFSDL